MSSPFVIVVIPNYNLINDLAECLDSIKISNYDNLLTIVVDNGSTDDSLKVLKESYPWVKMIRSEENLGYAGALNLGLRQGLSLGGEYFLAMNNDTIVPPDMIRQLVNVMESDQNLGMSAPKVLYYDDPKITFSLGDKIYPLLPVPVRFGRKKKDKKHAEGVLEFDYLFGCALFIRRELVEKIGLFDTSYFMFFEDADYCRRARLAGFKLGRVLDASLLHKASLSVKRQRPLMVYLRARNRSRFYRRYKHGLHPIFTFLVLLLGSLWKMALFLLRGDFSAIKPYVKGAIQGLFEPLPVPQGIEVN